MSVWGKVIAGGAGMLLGGPLGGVLGLALGHKIDKIRKTDSNNTNASGQKINGNKFSQYGENEKQLAFATGVIVIAAKLSKADGQVTQDEVKKFREVFDLNPKDEVAIGKLFNSAKKSSNGYEVYAKQLLAVFGNQQGLYIEFINSLYKIALADGDLHGNEEKMIKGIAEIFKMPSNLVESIKAQFFKSNQQYNISDDYKALLSEPNDSDEEVKKKYYKLAKEYHPDTLVSKGLPDEFLKFANERLSSINESYDRITQYRKNKN